MNGKNYLVDFGGWKIQVINQYFGIRIGLIMYGNYGKGLKEFDGENMKNCSKQLKFFLLSVNKNFIKLGGEEYCHGSNLGTHKKIQIEIMHKTNWALIGFQGLFGKKIRKQWAILKNHKILDHNWNLT